MWNPVVRLEQECRFPQQNVNCCAFLSFLPGSFVLVRPACMGYISQRIRDWSRVATVRVAESQEMILDELMSSRIARALGGDETGKAFRNEKTQESGYVSAGYFIYLQSVDHEWGLFKVGQQRGRSILQVAGRRIQV